MELQVLQQSIPVVEFNKEDLRVFLEQQLEKYKNLVVTVDTEKDCKKAKEIEEEEKEAQEILNAPEPTPIIHEESIKPVGLSKEAQGPELCATLRFYGTAAQFKCLKDVMTKIGIRYEKVDL